ncbi:hypothetical protein [Streptomyces anandii]|uniref:hypothetical protein n=1 Tax=Streptomyces anandii TaxID=285454 RepID=UPI00368228A7
MPNTFFELTPENYDEVYEKWMRVTPKEQAALNTTKVRVFLDEETIEILQNALEITLQTADNLVGALNEHEKRRIMQLGYGLEEQKERLRRKKRSNAERD